MSIYDSVEDYAKKLNMSLEQAELRVNYFLKIKEDIYNSRKCPKCHQHTLSLELGEWESGASDWVYCTNDDNCDFTDNTKNEYLFAFELDFDVVLMMSTLIGINNEQEVVNYIGLSWSKFVDNDTKELLEEYHY